MKANESFEIFFENIGEIEFSKTFFFKEKKEYF